MNNQVWELVWTSGLVLMAALSGMNPFEEKFMRGWLGARVRKETSLLHLLNNGEESLKISKFKTLQDPRTPFENTHPK